MSTTASNPAAKRRVSVLRQIEAFTDVNLKAFVRAYLECLLWSASDNEKNSWDINWILQDSFEKQVEESKKFLEYCYDNGLLSDDEDTSLMSQAGHDFSLSRNGHGEGFWSRSEDTYGPGIGDKISELCGWSKMFDEVDVEYYRRKISFS